MPDDCGFFLVGDIAREKNVRRVELSDLVFESADQYQFGVAAVFCLAAQEVGQQFVHFGFGDAPQIEHVFIRKLVFCLYAAPLCLRGHFDTAADDAVRGQEPSENAAAQLPFGFGVECDMPYPGEHRGVDAVIERLVRVRHRDQQAFFRSDDRSQNRLGRVEVREDERCIFSLVAFDITQQARGMGRCRFVERPFVFNPRFPLRVQEGGRSQQVQLFQVLPDTACGLVFFAEGPELLLVDGLRLETAYGDAVPGADTFRVILIRVVEGPDGRGQHFDLVIGQQPFSKHLAVNFCAAVDIFAVTDDDECYFFHNEL